MVAFEAGEYELADETLLGLFMITKGLELHHEKRAAIEFLVRTVRIYGTQDVIRHFADIPEFTNRVLSLIEKAERIRDWADGGMFDKIPHGIADLKWFAKELKSPRALFVLTGAEAKLAEQRGDFITAEKLFLEQLEYCNQPAVRNEENRAQVCADIARNALQLKKKTVAKEYLDMAADCRRKFKTTGAEIDRLEKELAGLK